MLNDGLMWKSQHSRPARIRMVQCRLFCLPFQMFGEEERIMFKGLILGIVALFGIGLSADQAEARRGHSSSHVSISVGSGHGYGGGYGRGYYQQPVYYSYPVYYGYDNYYPRYRGYNRGYRSYNRGYRGHRGYDRGYRGYNHGYRGHHRGGRGRY
jgi:hypothetical protein